MIQGVNKLCPEQGMNRWTDGAIPIYPQTFLREYNHFATVKAEFTSSTYVEQLRYIKHKAASLAIL